MTAKCLQGEHAPASPLAVEHLWCFGAPSVMSEEGHFLTNTTPHPNGWLRACSILNFYKSCYFRFSVVLWSSRGGVAMRGMIFLGPLLGVSHAYDCNKANF